MGFTKNGRNFFSALIHSVKFGDAVTINNSNTNVSYIPKIKNILKACGITETANTDSTNFDLSLSLGIGNTRETPNDYTLDYVENSSFIVDATSFYRADSIFTFTSTVRNISSENITIKEIGVTAWGLDVNKNKFGCLLFRKVLEKEVTILPDESYSFLLRVK